jgi:hypothetical protein
MWIILFGIVLAVSLCFTAAAIALQNRQYLPRFNR